MIRKRAFAKINLNTHLFPRKNEEAFTPVESVKYQIALNDELVFVNQKEKIELFCGQDNDLPNLEENIIYRAALLVKEKANNTSLGVRIELKKNIPVTAGLAGGSSDAGSTILALVDLWKLKFTQKDLFDIADSLGKDVPYFLEGGLCRLTGYDNLVEKIDLKLPVFYLVIVYPNVEQKPSTRWMYQNLDFSKTGKEIEKLDKLIEAVRNSDENRILENLQNDFETLAFLVFSETKKIKKDLYSNNADKVIMSGAGLGMIGFFKLRNQAKKAFIDLSKNYKKIYLTKTI